MKKLLLSLLSALFLGVVLLGVSAGAALYWYQASGPLRAPQTVLIEPGSSFTHIANELERAGVIKHALIYRIVSIAKGLQSNFKAGEYAFEAGVSPQKVSDIITAGESITHAVTIPEGKNSREIIEILMADDRLRGAIRTPIAEGSLLPDTHHIHRGDTRQSIIDRMRKARAASLDALWEQRADNLPFSTKQEALTLASIVEKETGVDGERSVVAGVFVNRLRKGMKLQSDPTVVYAIEQARGPMTRALTRKDWEFEHPYNTYTSAGLPPEPICHPGNAALKAVLNPPTHDYVYFVATGKGGHYFARSLREHNQNIARYKRALRGH